MVKSRKTKKNKTYNKKDISKLFEQIISKLEKIEENQKQLLNLIKNSPPKNEVEGKEEVKPDALKIKDEVEKKELSKSEEHISKVEREISLDIPSLRFKDNFKIEKSVSEKVEKFEKKREGGFFSKKLFGKKEESEKKKLENIVLDNLKKLNQISETRKQIVGISYILRQFLEIKFGVARSMTYYEIIEEIKNRKISDELKSQLLDFFNRLVEKVYKGEELDIDVNKAFHLANQVVRELSKLDKIDKLKQETK